MKPGIEKPGMLISLIVAVSDNGVIGDGGQLPWQQPADLQYFKKTTAHHHVVMGRRTFLSIGHPLPKRTNIVLSRDSLFQPEGCLRAGSLKSAVELAARSGESEIFIIGGAEVYRLGVTLADRIYLTRIHAAVSGDILFPSFQKSHFKEDLLHFHHADQDNRWPMSFFLYERLEEESKSDNTTDSLLAKASATAT